MSVAVFMLVLAGALLHAAWNIVVKGGSNKLYELGMNALGGGIGAILILPFAPLPDPACYWLLPLSALFHLLYYLAMAATYRVADLTLGYTVMRGAAPILTALTLWLGGIALPLLGWLGVILLCSGIFLLALQRGAAHAGKGIYYSLRASLAITAYTLADGYGARLSGDSLSYTCWLFALNIIPLHIYIISRHANEYAAYLRRRAMPGICGGMAGLCSYGIAIWAMTVAPIALVAALRETSVIFGMILAVIFLGEKLTATRFAAILLVAAGAILARLG